VISFLFKTVLTLAVLVGGSVLLVNNVPYLKANILEVVNPRVQEQKLVQKLQTTLTDLGNLPTGQAGAITSAARDKLITESKALLQNISSINDNHSGVVDGVISKVTDTLLGTPSVTGTPTPTGVGATQTPPTVTVMVTVTVTPSPQATASPCK
jgi:hypothetical protein